MFSFRQFLASTLSHDETVWCSEDATMEVQPEVSPDSEFGPVEELSKTIYTPTLNDHDYTYSGVPEKSTEEMLMAAQKRIEELEAVLEKQTLFVQLQMKPDSSTRFYTGFPSFEVLVATFKALRPTAENMYSWSQMQRLRNKCTQDAEGLRKTIKNCKLSLFDQFYLVLQKLRVGTLNQLLADNFNISQTTVSRIFISWVNFLYFMLGSFSIWPSRAKIQKHLPDCFKKWYPDCRGIIDASEIRVQAPSSLILNSEMYSSYKSHTTYKGNVVISPSGEIIHISSLFEGSISDKELVRQSGLLPLLQPGDQLMADKGFVIQDLLTPLGCEVVMPSFLSSKKQFSKGDLQESKKIHNLRVHVERAIRRVKEFHYFDKVIPLNVAGSINQIWTVACLITNFQGPLFYQ